MIIGKAIIRLERSEEESNRILSLVRESSGLPWVIFDKYAFKIDDTKFWRYAHSVLRVTGFRPNKGNSQVINQVLNGLKKNSNKHEKIFWDLYTRSVGFWLKKEKSKLNSFLAEFSYDNPAIDSTSLFKTVAKNRILFDISSEDLLNFHEAWWFDRVENIDSIITNLGINEASVKALAKSVLDPEIKKLEKKTSGLDKKIIQDVQKTIKQLKENEEKTKSSSALLINDLEKTLGDEIKSVDLSYSEKITSIHNSIKELNDSFELLSSQIDDLAEHKSTSNKNDNHNVELNLDAKSICRNVHDWKSGFPLTNNMANTLIKLILKCGAFYINSKSLFVALFGQYIDLDKVCEIIMEPSYRDSDGIYEDQGCVAILVSNYSLALIEATTIPLIEKSNSIYKNKHPKVFIMEDENSNSDTKASILCRTIYIGLDLFEEWCEMLEGAERLKCTEINLQTALSYGSEFLRITKNHNIVIPNETSESFEKVLSVVFESLPTSCCVLVSAKMTLYPYVLAKYGKSKLDILQEHLKDLLA